MQRAAAVAITMALVCAHAGCVTGAGVWKRDTGVKLPLLLGAIAADFVVTSAVAYQVQEFTVGASLGTGLAVTAVDFGIGCLIGSCRSLGL
jgi:hypothetical protein